MHFFLDSQGDFDGDNVNSYEAPKAFDAVIGRTGVFPYTDIYGKTINILRPPEEVFKSDSLNTTYPLPIFVGHPDSDKEKTQSQIGVTASRAEVMGPLLKTKVVLTAASKTKGKQQLSPGYGATIDWTPGVFEGKKYDGKQTNIVYDHIALVDLGRQGESVRLFSDSASTSKYEGFYISVEDSSNSNRENIEDLKAVEIQQYKNVDEILALAGRAIALGLPLKSSDFFVEDNGKLSKFSPEKAAAQLLKAKHPSLVLDSSASLVSLISLIDLEQSKTTKSSTVSLPEIALKNKEILFLNRT